MQADLVHILQRSADGGIGVAKTIRRPGDGERPQMGDKLTIRYSAMLDDGRVVLGGAKTTDVTLGMRMMWGTGGDIGLVSMRVGERCLLTCESDFTFGADGCAAGGVPPGARLTFDVELLAIKRGLALREVLRSLVGMLLLIAAVLVYIRSAGHR